MTGDDGRRVVALFQAHLRIQPRGEIDQAGGLMTFSIQLPDALPRAGAVPFKGPKACCPRSACCFTVIAPSFPPFATNPIESP